MSLLYFKTYNIELIYHNINNYLNTTINISGYMCYKYNCTYF